MTLARIQIRRDTTAGWAAVNPVLAAGEMGLDTTLMRVRIGDGATPWSGLGWGTMDPAQVAAVLAAADAIDGAKDADDALMTAVAADPTSAFNAQLNATMDEGVASRVPGEVSTALATDPVVLAGVQHATDDQDIPGQASAAVTIALAAQAGKIVQGTGSPQGVVTANPGTIYVDTVATLGASVWLKKSGTGNTGWVVLCGDTGWRIIPESDLINGWTGTNLAIRRINETVWFRGRYQASGSLNGTAATANPFYVCPSGFAPDGVGNYGSLGASFSDGARLLTDLGRLSTITRASSLSIVASWLAAPTWPTSLPGTPA